MYYRHISNNSQPAVSAFMLMNKPGYITPPTDSNDGESSNRQELKVSLFTSIGIVRNINVARQAEGGLIRKSCRFPIRRMSFSSSDTTTCCGRSGRAPSSTSAALSSRNIATDYRSNDGQVSQNKDCNWPYSCSGMKWKRCHSGKGDLTEIPERQDVWDLRLGQQEQQRRGMLPR
jgi:hypothetical protein